MYVVLIAELAHALSGHTDLAGYAFLFVVVWWAWLNGTLYHDLHGNNDIRTRVFTFLQMFSVASMAVFAHSALGEGSAGFALSYAAFQLILTYLWWRTGVHDPDHRPLSQPYVLAFLDTTLLFVVSVFVAAPWRFYLWGAGHARVPDAARGDYESGPAGSQHPGPARPDHRRQPLGRGALWALYHYRPGRGDRRRGAGCGRATSPCPGGCTCTCP